MKIKQLNTKQTVVHHHENKIFQETNENEGTYNRMCGKQKVVLREKITSS